MDSPWQAQAQRKARKIDDKTSVPIGGDSAASIDSYHASTADHAIVDSSHDDTTIEPAPVPTEDAKVEEIVQVEEVEVVGVDYGAVPDEPTGKY